MIAKGRNLCYNIGRIKKEGFAVATIQAFFSTALALVQLALMVAGVAPLGDEPIDYGGSYHYDTKNVTSWLTLAQDGASGYRIVVPASPGATETEGANQLRDYFRRITGAALPIVPDSEAAQEQEICVGATNRGGPDTAGLTPEGFIKKVEGERVFLAGNGPRGTLYAVFSFLEEQLGVRWFTPELTVVPESALLRVDAKLSDTQQPVFERRDTWVCVVENPDWKAHNKINTYNGEKYGGGIGFMNGGHSMEYLLPRDLYDTRPELFAWRIDENANVQDHPCLTNPDVLGIITGEAGKILKANKTGTLMSLTQPDNQKYCQCERCRAEAARLGGQSGLMVWFVNQVARAFKDEYPDAVFHTFAYQYTRRPPAFVVPGPDGNVAEGNVAVELCSIECCFAHPLEECGHERGESLADYVGDKPSTFAGDLKGWPAHCQRLYIYNYALNAQQYMRPFPDLQVLSPNIKFFAGNSVRSVFVQGNTLGGSKTAEFDQLRCYVMSKLLWDPDADVEYHMMDFMKAYYGEGAAPYIKEYLDALVRKTVKTSHLFIFNWHYENTFLRLWDTLPMDRLWDSAEQAAATQWQLDNIRRSRLSLRVYKADMLVGEFFPLNPCRIEENKKLYQDMLDLGITYWGEYKPIVPVGGLDWLMRPVEWAAPGKLPWN